MARRIRSGELSAREVLAAHLAQIERLNPRLNAIVTLCVEQAQRAATEADERQARGEELGPLHGLPVVHKDLFETRGIRTTFGSPLFRDYMPAQNDSLIDCWQAAGAITVGKSNTPEFGAGSQTFNAIFGPTLNPYDPTKTCGGSSGGSAVALACGMVPLADGTDLGGSLRNPAAYCNVVGFRPSIGLVPDTKPWLGPRLGTSGCMARSVDDLALGLSVLADEPAFRQLPERSFAGTRVAWFRDLGGVPFDSRVRSVIDSQRTTLESLGCHVEEAEPDFSQAEVAFRILRAWNAANAQGTRYHEHPAAYKRTLAEEIETGLRLTEADTARGISAQAGLEQTFTEFLAHYDYFILPTSQLPPFDITLEYPPEIAGVAFESYIDWMKSCWYISATRRPAISVPAGFTPEGLPVGLQIVGRDDIAVLQLARAFELATGFARQRPPGA